MLEHFMASGSDHYEIEFRMRHRDGSYRDILAQASIFRDEDGRATRALGSHVDVTEAKRTERALRESQAELQRAQRVAHVGSWRFSLETGQVTASEEARRIYGVSPDKTTLSMDEVRGYPLEEYRPMLDHAMEGLIGRGKPYDVEFRIARGGDGEIRDIHSVAQYDAANRVVFGIIQDITDRRRAEEAYSEICRMTSELICIADLNSAQFLQVNPAFEKLLGYSASELTERSFLEFVHPDDLEATRAVIRDELLKGNDLASFENRYRCVDGEYRHLNWTSHVMAEPGKVFAIAHDVTERKEVMRALQENEERFRSLVEGAPDAIIVQVDGKMAYVNAAGQELLGAESADDLLGTDVLDRLPPEAHERMRRRMEKLNKHKQQVEPLEEIWLGLDGREIPLEVSAVPTVYDGKDGAIVFGRDVRARKQLEGQLLQAQKLEAVGRLAGGVAHDFNNMLQTILGYADVLLLESDEADSAYECLTEIRSAAQRSADLTRQLLAFARKQAVHPRTLELNDTVAGMLKMLQRLIREEIDLIWQPGRDVGWIRMDPAQIDQVLANLVVNARDAIRGGGTITIETGHVWLTREDCAGIADAAPGEYASLAVSDDGQGMAPETVEQIFEPFFTTKEHERGTGLGLATVYGIVKQNRGFINVYSEPDVGTTFRVYLPRHARPERLEDAAVEAGAPGGSETILLVEDDGAILRLGRQILAQLGYTVLAANSPGEALEICRERTGQIDLLLTDVVMPEMSGRDLAGQAEQYCPSLRCLYMSGYTANVIAHRGVLDEGVEFIQKPFTRTALATKVRSVLDNHRGQ
jgi:PAS domain S-box-containing protein